MIDDRRARDIIVIGLRIAPAFAVHLSEANCAFQPGTD